MSYLSDHQQQTGFKEAVVYGSVGAAPAESPAIRIGRASDRALELCDRVQALATRLCGPVLSAVDGSADSKPDGSFFPLLGATADRLLAETIAALRAVERIERELP